MVISYWAYCVEKLRRRFLSAKFGFGCGSERNYNTQDWAIMNYYYQR